MSKLFYLITFQTTSLTVWAQMDDYRKNLFKGNKDSAAILEQHNILKQITT